MGVTAAAVERQQPFRDARGPGAIVFDPARLRQAEPAMLEPEFWNGRAEPVSGQGGRGAAWFVSGDDGDAVLRHYRRGGLMARFSQDAYLWMGESRVRSVAEFRLLGELHGEGLPVPAPLLAGYRCSGLLYRAAILIERIPQARALADWLGPQADQAPWEAVGATIARFHRAGVEHADLNAHNILVDAAGKVWLIDFDRGRRRRPEAAWRRANLARLSRSLAKLSGGDDAWRDGFVRLIGRYESDFAQAPA